MPRRRHLLSRAARIGLLVLLELAVALAWLPAPARGQSAGSGHTGAATDTPATEPGTGDIGGEAPAAPIDDVGPVDVRPFPPDYGPDPAACFSPLRVPAEVLASAAGGTGGAGAGGTNGESGPPPEGTSGPAAAPVYLTLNVAARRLYVYRAGGLDAAYLTAVGTAAHHTITGLYSVVSKAVYPTWYPPDGRDAVPPGPGNPLGSRWMGFSPYGFGLHGTNAIWSIGRSISLGCVRMRNEDAERVFDLVRLGTPFRVVYEPVEVAVYPPQGGLVLSLSRDIYDRVGNYADFVAARLEQAGGSVAPDLLAWLLETAAEYDWVTLDTAAEVVLSGRFIRTEVVRAGAPPGDFPRISVRAFGEALGLSVGWDQATNRPTLDGRPVPALLVAGRAFAGINDLAAAAGLDLEGKWEWFPPAPGSDLARGRLTIDSPGFIYVNNVGVARQAFRAEDGTYIPLRPVAEALGLSVWWDAGRSVALLGGTEIAVTVVDGSSFVRADVLAAHLAGFATVVVTDAGVFISR